MEQIKMKNIYVILGMFLLAGCAQDMGHYVNLPTQSPCKMVSISPNRTGIENTIYEKLVAWIETELPKLGYVIVDPTAEGAPSTCGKVIIHYSKQFLPNHETPSATTDSMTCVNTPTLSLTRHQLTLEIQKMDTKENILRISAEMESSETDQDRILSDIENSLYSKFLQVQGPESQAETKATRKILPA